MEPLSDKSTLTPLTVGECFLIINVLVFFTFLHFSG